MLNGANANANANAANASAPGSGDAPGSAVADFARLQPGTPRWRLSIFVTGYLTLLLAMLPIKLAMSLNSYEAGFFPLGLAEWMFSLWPPSILPPMAALALLLTLVYAPLPGPAQLRRHVHLLLPYLGLLVAAAIGNIAGFEQDEARLFLGYMLGLYALVAAVYLHLRAVPEARFYLLLGVVAGVGYSAAYACYQKFFELAAFRKDMQYLAEQSGQPINPDLWHRIMQDRIYAKFANPNNLAAHLVLTVPLVLATVLRAGSLDDVPAERRATYGVLLAGLFGYVLWHTGSRGGLLAAALVGGLAILGAAYHAQQRYPQQRRRILVGFAVVGLLGMLAGGALLWKLQTARSSGPQSTKGMASVNYRLEYWSAAIDLFKTAPLTGGGIGEYMNHHLLVKPPRFSDEARLPHNFVLNFLSQCGVFGGLAALYLLATPLLLGWQIWRGRLRTVDPWIAGAALLGLTGWLAHALVDFNIQVPATVLTMAILPLLAVDFAAERRLEEAAGTAADDAAPATATAGPAPLSPALRRVQIVVLLLLAVGALKELGRIPGDKALQAFMTASQKPTAAAYLLRSAEQVAALQPGVPHVWWRLAKIANAQHDYSLAESCLRRTVAMSPNRAKYHAELARTLACQQRYPEASAEAAIAIARYPNNPMYHFLLVNIDLLAGDYEAADAKLNVILLTWPDYAVVQGQVAQLRLRQGRVAESAEAIDIALFYEPDEPIYLYLKAEIKRIADSIAEGAVGYTAPPFLTPASVMPLPLPPFVPRPQAAPPAAPGTAPAPPHPLSEPGASHP